MLYYVGHSHVNFRGIYRFAGRDGDSYRVGVEIKAAYLFYTGVDAYRSGARPVGDTEPLQLNASSYRPFLRYRIHRYYRIRDVPLGATVD